MAYTAEDWQAQLEEVLALQSIYAENFRVLHIPGLPAQHTPAQHTSSGSSSSGSGSSQDGDTPQQQPWEDLEQQLEALIGSEPPPAAAATGEPGAGTGVGLLSCEALVSVELPAGQLQLMVDMDTLGSSSSSSSIMQQQQQAQEPQAAGSRDAPRQQEQQKGQEQPPPLQQQQQQQQAQEAAAERSLMPFGPPIKHLPPVRVQLQLPLAYPSSPQAPPAVTLHASWLNSKQQQALAQQLQQVWQEQGPGPVCFSWLEHIKVAALPELGITEQLLLSAGPCMQQQQQQQAQGQQAQAQGQQQQAQAQQQQGSRATGNGGGGGHSKQLSAAAPAFIPTGAPAAAAVGSKSSSSSSRGRGRGQGGGRGRASRDAQASQQQQQQHNHHETKQHDPQRQQEEKQQQEQQQQQQQHNQPPPPGSRGSSGGMQSAEQLGLQLLRYDAARELDDFNSSSWTCNICFEQVPGSSCLRLPECRHFYCRPCLSASAAAQLDSGAVENMRCPEPSCRRLLPPYIVKELLGNEEFARWEELVLSRALDRMDDVVYCPRCDSVCVADSDGCAQCPQCFYAFCAECSDSWHPGSACLNLEERVRILGRRRRGTTPEDRLRDLDLQAQAMSLKFIASSSKACPVCGMATMKNEGCNKMTCTNCGQAWCWKCNQGIPGYEHFRDNPLCVLFDQAEIDRWHAMLFANERAQQVEALHMGVMRARQQQQHVGARLCRCPVCAQENLREGRNNLLRCWSCSSHFCYACRAWLRGKVGLHYVGAKACKQHGD